MKKKEKHLQDLRNKAARAARSGDDRKGSDCSLELAQCLREEGDTEEALEVFQNVITLARRAHERTDEILATRAIAEIYSENGDEQCQDYLDKFEALVKDDPTEHQLMLTVAAYCLNKIYAMDDSKEHLLQQARKYAEQSLRMLDTETMDAQKMLEGDSKLIREINCHRMLAEICGYQRNQTEAERHSKRAFDLAAEKGRKEAQFEIMRTRIDFPWRVKITTALELFEFSKSMKKDLQLEAALFLVQAHFESREIDNGRKVLFDISEVGAHGKRRSGPIEDDSKKYSELLIFAFKAGERMKQLAKAERENNQSEQYRLHDKLGDLYIDAGFKAAALYHYEKALRLTDGQNDDANARSALISCAETAADLKYYEKADGYFGDLIKVEESMNIDRSEALASQFKMRLLSGKWKGAGDIEFAIDCVENSGCTKFLHSVYETAAKHYESRGMRNEAERYRNLEKDVLGVKNEKDVEEEDKDENDKNRDSLDVMDDNRILEIMRGKARETAKKKALAKAGRKENQYGESKLIERAREGNLADVKILVEQGADINKADPMGWTPLSEAVGANHLDVVQFLLSKGAKPNSQSTGGWVDSDFRGKITPLMEACANGFHEIAMWLLNHSESKELAKSTNLDGWSAADFMSDHIKRARRDEESEAEFRQHLAACKAVFEKIQQLQRIQGFPVRQGSPPPLQPLCDDTDKFAAEKAAAKKRERRVPKRKGGDHEYQEAMSLIGSKAKQADKENKRTSGQRMDEDLFNLSDDEPLVRAPTSASAKKTRAIVVSSDSESEGSEKKDERRLIFFSSLDLDDRNFGLGDDDRSTPLKSMIQGGSQAKKVPGVQRLLRPKGGAKKRSIEIGDENGVSIVPDDYEEETRKEPVEKKRRTNESESSQSEACSPAQPAERRDSLGSLRAISESGAAQSPIGDVRRTVSPVSLSSASSLASTFVRVMRVRPGAAPEVVMVTKAPSETLIADLPKLLEEVRKAIDGGTCEWMYGGAPLDATTLSVGDVAEMYNVRVVEVEFRLKKTLRGEVERRGDVADRPALSSIFEALAKFESGRAPTLELKNEPNYSEKSRDSLWRTLEEYGRQKREEDGKWRVEGILIEHFRDIPPFGLRSLIRMRPRESLSLRFCGIDDAKLEEIAEEMNSWDVSKLSSLDLSFNHTIASSDVLSHTLDTFKGVRTLILQGLSGIEDGRLLMQTLGVMSLSSLVLDENPWLDDICMEELLKGETIDKLSVLKLSKVAVRTMVWMANGDSLKSLKSLSLAENNGIAASGWERVAGFIRSSSTGLKSLDIKGTAVRPSFLEALASRSPEDPILTVIATRCSHISPSEICRVFAPLAVDGQRQSLNNLKLHIEREKVDEVNETSPLIASRYLKAVALLPSQ